MTAHALSMYGAPGCCKKKRNCELAITVGSALPPRHLQIHDLAKLRTLSHPEPIQAVLPHEQLNTAATLGLDGSLLLWQLQPLLPLTRLQAPG